MKLKQQQTLAVGGLLALGVVVALVGLLVVVLPQRSKAQSLDTSIALAQARLIALNQRGPTMPAIRAAELFQLARAMPDTPDMPGILLDLARTATSASVTLASVQTTAATTLADGSSAVPLTVVVDGQWGGLARFLAALRRQVEVHRDRLAVAGRLFDVDNIQIMATKGSALQATLAVNAFSYGLPVPVTPTSTTTTQTTTATTTTSPGTSQAAGATGSAG